ncbi:MAG: hypothetical protein NC926_10925, partial [Candidatus Omnitrophica bacterium]|nr:hypothetical protein [Candidatus Omnitrophota bacterium]
LGKTYYWHVKYKDVEGNWSEWSDETCFTTGVNVPPEKPKNLSPSNGATNISLTPTLTASEFRDYDGDSFYQAEWAIYEGTKEIYNTRNKLTYLAVGEGILDYETTYSWCVRYSDIYGNWSLWSNKTSFTTIPRPPIPPETPVNIYPVEINGVELNPTLKATAFLDQNKGDTFKKSYWQIREANNNEKLNDGTYINPYWEKEAGPVNYIKVDRQLKPNTKYYWHVKYQDSTGNWSSWSEETYFITKDGTQTTPTSGGGCFIASVCFGEDSWQVKILRNFRDKILVKSILGKNIVSLYYKISPKIAETLKINNFLKILVKVFLYPIIIFVFLILEPYLFIFLVFVCIIFYNELKRRKKYEV